MRKEYFHKRKDDPAPLVASCRRTVRFEEVDMLKIMWHGHYPSYFEDGRQAIGRAYGLSYHDFYSAGIAAPIRKLEIDYLHPLRFGDECTIEAILHYTEAARINYEYRLYNQEGLLCTTGYSVQMLVCAKEQDILLTPPDFIVQFLENWRAGTLK